MKMLRFTAPLAAALALLGFGAQASAQSVTVQGQVQYQPYGQQQGYGQPPPGYGQQPQQPYAQPYQQPQYQQQPVYQQPQVRYVERTSSIKGLWIPGMIIFGVSWGLSASFGQLGWDSDYRTWMWIPVIGPWAALSYSGNEDETVGAIVGGLLQTAGLTMFILGLALQRTVRVAVYALDDHDERSPTLAFEALPAPGGAQLGLTLSHF
ncbi:MAG: hypothetical protein VYE22_10715 [Myxococcota bacterium]|nr:hypothetical protein [Myxococcota bacterium]